MFGFFALLLTVHLASAQVTQLGPCPNVEVVKNFDVKKYTGLWYEIKKYPTFFSIGAKCITANYQLKSDNTVSVLNTQIVNGIESSISGTARIISSGILGVSFPSVPCKLNQLTSYNIFRFNFSFPSQCRSWVQSFGNWLQKLRSRFLLQQLSTSCHWWKIRLDSLTKPYTI